MKNKISYHEKKPSLPEYKYLRDAVRWNTKDVWDIQVIDSLMASPYCICAYKGYDIIGMVRITGDKGMYGYIQDTIVLPEYQKKGIGTKMMKKLLSSLEHKVGYLIGVCPSKQSVRFYERFGFKKRPENPNGFMYMEIKDE